MNRQPTMQEIARELGLSRRTVSSVINAKAAERHISNLTAQRVIEHLRQRGYVPSKQAVALKSGARGAVGVLHSGRLYSHLVEAFNRIVDEASTQAAGVEIVVVPRANIAEGFRELVARGVAKIVWIQTAPAGDELHQPDLLLPLFAHATVVIYNHRFEEPAWDRRLAEAGAYMVGVDRAAAYEKQALFLKRLGHQCVAFPEVHSSQLFAPLNVKIQMFRKHGIEVALTHPDRTQFASTTESATAMAHGLLAAMKKQPITAAVFQDDLVAGLAMAELARHGIAIPGDLTVNGFDGLEITQITTPTLTSLRIPVAAMVDCVLKILETPPERRRHCFDIEIVPGGSHARAKQEPLTPRRKP
ncbi:MAG TPA: LacI family DNA-binding transcriptional regulator [Planctomycetota bacterium]|nr:LacI family DNA-binding transcriptional regulator [Planctomycetota bacterium]